MTTVVIMPFLAKDAAICQVDEPKHYGMNENAELCGCRVMTHSSLPLC